jgi:fructose 1,6-bisphosphate aldolase/phosphatase
VGKDDPVCIVRAQGIFPAVGEVLEPFASPILVEGWMRGSHMGPLMPVSVADSTPSRFDGPPRLIGLGYQLCEGKLVGPRDMLADKSFNLARHQANEMADMMRRHGPFEPHRLPLEEMEYTTMPEVMEKVKDRFVDLD